MFYGDSMGLFSKSDVDKLLKYLNKKNIGVKSENGKYNFEIVMKNCNYSLFPYFQIANDNFSIIINLRRIDKVSIELLQNINNFNLKCKFFKALLKNNILYLEANMLIDDNVINIFDALVNEIASLEEDIDNL